MVKNFGRNFFNFKVNLLVKIYKKRVTGTSFIEERIWHLLLHWVTVDKITIIQERIGLKFSDVKLNFWIISMGGDRFRMGGIDFTLPPWKIGLIHIYISIVKKWHALSILLAIYLTQNCIAYKKFLKKQLKINAISHYHTAHKMTRFPEF